MKVESELEFPNYSQVFRSNETLHKIDSCDKVAQGGGFMRYYSLAAIALKVNNSIGDAAHVGQDLVIPPETRCLEDVQVRTI